MIYIFILAENARLGKTWLKKIDKKITKIEFKILEE